MSKHTPGPWSPEFEETYNVRGPDGGRVAICMNLKGRHGLAGRRSGDEVAANARLIAAAPDGLSFAESHDAYMSKHYPEGPDSNVLHPDAAANWKRCREFIAKATGAQQ